jgi:hypothetical protein
MSLSGTTEKKTYFYPIEGKWATKVDKGTPGAVCRTLTKGKNKGTDRYELRSDYLEGTLQSIHSADSDHEKQMVITLISDEGEVGVVSFGLKDRIGLLFLNYIPDLNMLTPIRIAIKQYEGDDSINRNYIFVSVQEGNNWVNAKQRYEKFTGLPEIEKVPVGTKTVFDPENRYRALFKVAKANIYELNEFNGEPYFDEADKTPTPHTQNPPSSPKDFLDEDVVEPPKNAPGIFD